MSAANGLMRAHERCLDYPVYQRLFSRVQRESSVSAEDTLAGET